MLDLSFSSSSLKVLVMMLISTHADPLSSNVPKLTLDDIIVHPMLPPLKIQKRETSTSGSVAKYDGDFAKFIEEKLVQHTRALEHLVNVVQSNEDLTKRLIDNLGHYASTPKMPEKIEVQRVASSDKVDDNDHPIVRAGKNTPLYGNLFKDLIVGQAHKNSDPIPFVEKSPPPMPTRVDKPSQKPPKSSRRLMPVPITNDPEDDKISRWCPVAMLCRRTREPICGFDDRFGYGKFEDICHMLQVNCYWKYNFAIVPTCHPTYLS
ncbi:uncharacterized protein LOC126380579 isoform X2 [Pectinophora gossypiella]|uniref:uncharacterized protein LOC126380579 isoform X2 n=1 Tax=Pectinophora gossypiella TaxID=13191 RepID=UPI00214EF6A6|nr:uncharacterized protein LOC126380579 isoform X2 [Pectinophora gossypiella]